MPEQHVKVLTGLGLPQDQIDVLEKMTPEELKDFKPEVFVDPIKANMKTIFSNDTEFLANIPKDKISPKILKEIESGQYARFQNELIEVATTKLGLKDKEDLTDEDRKSIKGLVEKMAVTYLTKNSKVEGLQAMQQELATARQQLTELTGKQETALNKKLEEVNGQHTAKLIKVLTGVELASIDGVELGVAAKYVTGPILDELTKEYSIVLGPNDDLVLMQKANPTLKVIDTAGKEVTFADAAKKVILEKKLGVEKKKDDGSGGGDNKKKKVVIDGSGGDGGGGQSDIELPSYIKDKVAQNEKLEGDGK